MGQIEVYKYMENLRVSGDKKYYSPKEVSEGMKNKGMSNGALKGVWVDLRRLEVYGYLEAVMTGSITDWRRCYRLKKKYVNVKK